LPERIFHEEIALDICCSNIFLSFNRGSWHRPGTDAHRLGGQHAVEHSDLGRRSKGFLQENGLNAEVIAISASTIVIQALLTGEVDFIIAPSATLVTSRLAGADTVMVSTNLPLFIDHIVSLGDITSVEQLKGKIGGVNRLGTTSDMTLRLALRPLRHRSRKRHENHRHRRESAAPRGSFAKHHAVHPFRGTLGA